MMKKKNWGSFFTGMVTMLLLICLTGSALAVSGKVTKELEYRNISVTLDGVKLDLRDAKGNAVEPFMFEGTNYLPVRALAESLGLEVAWDSANATVVLTTPDDAEPSTEEGPSDAADSLNTFLFSKDHIRFYYTGYEENSDGSFALYIRVENDSDYTIAIGHQDFAINSVKADCSFSFEILPGDTKTEAIKVSKEAIEETGVEDVKRFSVIFVGRDVDSSGYHFNTGVARITLD